MLATDNTGFIKKSENFEESSFKINASAKAFDILSNGLYQNKTKAVIRELACNAWDAHVAAKTQHKRYDLWIPTQDSPQFKIRDYGTGLSREDVETIYTTYFESTKTNSNDFVGCLGLGSKTPFCITDNFQVTSYFNKKKYIYNAHLSEERIPKVSLIAEMDTEEENGLEISFAVEFAQVYSFQREYENVFYWFEQECRPKLKTHFGLNKDFENRYYDTIPVRNKIYETKNVTIYTTNVISQCFVRMGNVAYPVDIGASFDPKLNFFNNVGSVIEVPIGAVDVAASRESLSLNKRSIQYLSEQLENCLDSFEKEKSKHYDSLPSYIEACKDYQATLKSLDSTYNESSRFLSSFHRKAGFEYKGKLIQTYWDYSPNTWIYNYSKRSYHSRAKNRQDIKVEESSANKFALDEISDTIIILNDTDKTQEEFSKNKAKYWLKVSAFEKLIWIKEKADLDILTDVVEVPKENILTIAELKALYKKLPPRKKSQNSGPRKTSETVYEATFGKYSSDSVVEVDFEKDSGIYVFVSKNQLWSDAEYKEYCNFGHLRTSFKFSKDDLKIYGVTARQYKKFKDNPLWVPLEKACVDILENFASNKDNILKSLIQRELEEWKKETEFRFLKTFKEKANVSDTSKFSLDFEAVGAMLDVHSETEKSTHVPYNFYLENYNNSVFNLDSSVKNFFEVEINQMKDDAAVESKKIIKEVVQELKRLYKDYPILNFQVPSKLFGQNQSDVELFVVDQLEK